MGNAPGVLPPLDGNPLLAAREERGALERDHPERQRLVRRYAYGVPTAAALDAAAEAAPGGIVEIGAGSGYWARLLHERGVDVVAYDVAPPPSGGNQHVDAQAPWFPVHRGDETAVLDHPSRTLLLVWPTSRGTWAADAVAHFHAVGGRFLVYVGEGPGGVTGDATLHAHLGIHGPCMQCHLGVPDAACVCGVVQLYERVRDVPLPQWADATDSCGIYQRATRARLRLWRRQAAA
jgi:hypothetical protein